MDRAEYMHAMRQYSITVHAYIQAETQLEQCIALHGLKQKSFSQANLILDTAVAAMAPRGPQRSQTSLSSS